MEIDIKAIAERLAGQLTFEKGQELYKNQAVISYHCKDSQVVAQVQGTYVYDVNLTVTGSQVDGGCTCPASEGFDFCKHCVAVILYYNEQQAALLELLKGGPGDRVKGYLLTLDNQALSDALFTLISKDIDVLNQWVMFADVHFNQFDVKDMRKRIVKALPLRDVWRHQQVRNYFEKARKQMVILLEVIARLPAKQGYDLCVFCLARYDKILERIDDSGGFRFGVYNLIEAQLIECVKQIEESDQIKVQRLFALLDNEFLHIDFGDVGARFIAENQLSLQSAFYEQLAKRVDSMKRPTASATVKYKAQTYSGYLANYYERLGQVERAVAFAFSAKVNFATLIGLLNRLLEEGKYEKVKTYMEELEGLVRSDDERKRFISITIELKKALGEQDSATKLAFELFENSLKLEDYARILEVSASTQVTQVNAKVEAIFDQALANDPGRASSIKSQRLDFYIYTRQIEPAISQLASTDYNEGQLHELAFLCLVEQHPNEALRLYRRLINGHILRGKSRDYRIAVDLIKELIEKKEMLNHPTNDISTLLAELNHTHASRDQFIQLLQNEFEHF